MSANDPAYLLCYLFHVLPYKIVARGVEEDWEFPWIAKGDEMGLSWEELDIEDSEGCDLLPSSLGLVYSVS